MEASEIVVYPGEEHSSIKEALYLVRNNKEASLEESRKE